MSWRTCRRLIVAVLLLLPLQPSGGLFLSPIPAAAQTVDPPDCGPDLDGVTWKDPRTGEKWKCKKVGDGWEWRPAGTRGASHTGADPRLRRVFGGIDALMRAATEERKGLLTTRTFAEVRPHS